MYWTQLHGRRSFSWNTVLLHGTLDTARTVLMLVMSHVCASVPLQGVSDGYKHGASSFFAMYRFDFMLDQQLRPYIMEVPLLPGV